MILMRKTLFILVLLFFFPSVGLADDTETLVRTVWACKGGTAMYKEFRTAMLEGRKDLASPFIKKRICLRLEARTEIHILGSEGGFGDEIIIFRRKGRYEGLTTEKWYALAPPGAFSTDIKRYPYHH